VRAEIVEVFGLQDRWLDQLGMTRADKIQKQGSLVDWIVEMDNEHFDFQNYSKIIIICVTLIFVDFMD
jgi:hypothetical protein